MTYFKGRLQICFHRRSYFLTPSSTNLSDFTSIWITPLFILSYLSPCLSYYKLPLQQIETFGGVGDAVIALPCSITQVDSITWQSHIITPTQVDSITGQNRSITQVCVSTEQSQYSTVPTTTVTMEWGMHNMWPMMYISSSGQDRHVDVKTTTLHYFKNIALHVIQIKISFNQVAIHSFLPLPDGVFVGSCWFSPGHRASQYSLLTSLSIHFVRNWENVDVRKLSISTCLSSKLYGVLLKVWRRKRQKCLLLTFDVPEWVLQNCYRY